MKIVILNGSPRKGNTLDAINAFTSGLHSMHSVEVIDTYKLKVSPCTGCRACENHKGCVATDDSNMIVDTLVAADMIVIAAPVYWYGIAAQPKMVLDKCYCRARQLKGKKVGFITIGGAAQTHRQYELIKGQYECCAEALNWDMQFNQTYTATHFGDLIVQDAVVEELRLLGSKL